MLKMPIRLTKGHLTSLRLQSCPKEKHVLLTKERHVSKGCFFGVLVLFLDPVFGPSQFEAELGRRVYSCLF